MGSSAPPGEGTRNRRQDRELLSPIAAAGSPMSRARVIVSSIPFLLSHGLLVSGSHVIPTAGPPTPPMKLSCAFFWETTQRESSMKIRYPANSLPLLALLGAA